MEHQWQLGQVVRWPTTRQHDFLFKVQNISFLAALFFVLKLFFDFARCWVFFVTQNLFSSVIFFFKRNFFSRKIFFSVAKFFPPNKLFSLREICFLTIFFVSEIVCLPLNSVGLPITPEYMKYFAGIAVLCSFAAFAHSFNIL